MEDLRVYRLASFLIRNYGAEAAKEAARRADEMRTKNDQDRHQLWLDVHAATQRQLGETYAGKSLPADEMAVEERRYQSGS